jgi:hypothetical protein
MTLGNLEKLIQSEKTKVQKALNHLNYSLKKIEALGTDINLDVLEDLEKLEVWESFTSRFSRLSDIVSKKLIRSLVLKGDPSFRGSLIDFLNVAEKLGYISSTNRWWAIRSLRNKEAHEYTDEDLIHFFQSIKNESSFLISETENLLKKI